MANCAKEEAALRALQNQIKIATQGSRTNVAQLRRDIVAAKMALQKCKNASGAMLVMEVKLNLNLNLKNLITKGLNTIK